MNQDHDWKKAEKRKRHPWRKYEEDCYQCARCGYLHFMTEILSPSMLEVWGVPDCDVHIMQKVMDA